MKEGYKNLFDIFKKKTSSDVAKDRLKLLLVSDRANCTPELMEMIKNDIINVISKYMDIDADGLEIQITQTELCLSTPLILGGRGKQISEFKASLVYQLSSS